MNDVLDAKAVATMTTLTADQIAEVVRIVRATEPRPAHVTREQAAEMLEVSAPTLRRLIAQGVIRTNACGKIPITQVDAAIAARRPVTTT